MLVSCHPGSSSALSLSHTGWRSAVQVLAGAISAAEFDCAISQLLIILADIASPCQIIMHHVYEETSVSAPLSLVCLRVLCCLIVSASSCSADVLRPARLLSLYFIFCGAFLIEL